MMAGKEFDGIFACLIFMLFNVPVRAQEDLTHSATVESRTEQLVAGSEDDQLDLSEFLDHLQDLAEHPLNINTSEWEDFISSGILSEMQIASLIKHRERFGKLIALQELLVVPDFSPEFIRSVAPYLTTGIHLNAPNASLRRMLQDGTHTFILRSALIPESKRGYLDEGSGPKYAGDPFGVMFKYRFKFMNKLSFGLTAEKDPGERFAFKNGSKGFDYYSGHIAIRDVGMVNNLVVGDYQLSYGQGLVIGGSLSGSGAADPLSVGMTAPGIRPYTSTGEIFFKRGVAVSLKRKKFSMDFFSSYRSRDANLVSTDSLDSSQLFSSLQTSGLHRTEEERNDQNAVSEWFYGGNVRFRHRNFKIGCTGFHAGYDRAQYREQQPYNQFEFSGSKMYSIGVDYSLHYRNVYAFGETAADRNLNIAALNGVVISADSRLALSVLYRYYPVKYQNLYGSPFGKSSKMMNEKGFYTGISIRPSGIWNVVFSLDQFWFPWLKYQMDAPSSGRDFSLQLNYLPSRNTTLYLRLISRTKAFNTDDEQYHASYTGKSNYQGIRVHWSSKVSKMFTLRSRAEWIRYREGAGSGKGLAIYQDIGFHPLNSRWKLNFRYAIFDTDDYDSRIYAYENDVLYSYSMTPYSDSGSRLILNIRFKMSRSLDFWFRYAVTFYDHKDSVGSGWEEIQGNRKSEIKLQLRCEF